jgi:hypothetical protein
MLCHFCIDVEYKLSWCCKLVSYGHQVAWKHLMLCHFCIDVEYKLSWLDVCSVMLVSETYISQNHIHIRALKKRN